MRTIASVLILAALTAAIQWIPVPGATYPSGIVGSQTFPDSSDQCTSACEQQQGCIGAIYQSSTKTCTLHSAFTGVVVIDSTFTIYVSGITITTLGGLQASASVISSSTNSLVNCLIIMKLPVTTTTSTTTFTTTSTTTSATSTTLTTSTSTSTSSTSTTTSLTTSTSSTTSTKTTTTSTT
ncbi:hypothetical protein HDU99_009477, partial [Rhizoclosmatium hyalinum]